VHGHAKFFGGADEVILTLLARLGLPRLHDALGERLRAVRQREVGIDGDDPAEALAGRAGADGIVEGEERRRRFAVVEVAGGAVETGGKMTNDRGPRTIGGGADEVMLRVISMLEGMGKK
jgi:hypothetical protein